MNFDWRELGDALKQARDEFRAGCFDGAPPDHGEAMRRHGKDQGLNEAIEIVRKFFTDKEPHEDDREPKNERDDD